MNQRYCGVSRPNSITECRESLYTLDSVSNLNVTPHTDNFCKCPPKSTISSIFRDLRKVFESKIFKNICF